MGDKDLTRIKSGALAVLIIGAVGLTYTGIRYAALHRTAKSNFLNDDVELVKPSDETIRTHTLPPTGDAPIHSEDIELIKFSPGDARFVRPLPHIGDVRALSGYENAGDSCVWVQGPSRMTLGKFSAELRLPGCPPIALPIEATSMPRIGRIYIRSNYAPGVDHANLAILENGHELKNWKLEGLPRTHEMWSGREIKDHAKFGEAALQVYAWHEPFPSQYVNHSLNTSLTCLCVIPKTVDRLLSSGVHDRWEISRNTTLIPHFATTPPRKWISFTEVYIGPDAPDTWTTPGDFFDPQPVTKLTGDFVHYQTFDDKIVFHGLRVGKVENDSKDVLWKEVSRTQTKEPQVNSDQTYVVIGNKPITAISEHGVRMTLFPQRNLRRNPTLTQASQPNLSLSYRFDTNGSSPSRSSPLGKAANRQLTFSLWPKQGKRLHSFDNQADPIEHLVMGGRYAFVGDRLGPLRTSPGTIVMDFPFETSGANKDLTLIVRHRIEIERHPYEIVAPVLPSKPVEAKTAQELFAAENRPKLANAQAIVFRH